MENYGKILKSINTSKFSKVELEMHQKHLQEVKNFGKAVELNLFNKTTSLKVAASKGFTPTEETIKEIFKLIIEREKNKGKPGMHLDYDIWNWFPDFQEGHKAFESNSFTFIKNITNANILKEGERLSLKTVHAYTEASSIIIQAILDGEVDKVGTWKITYFEAKNKEGKTVLYRFNACRDGDGQLNVLVDEVDPGFKWGAGDGVYFSNKETEAPKALVP